jgi:GNAT superfamily N-acetyltransferase
MKDVRIRSYAAADLGACRVLWAEMTQHHRELYGDPNIGGDRPGLHFDEHLSRAGAERLWVAECDGQVVGLTGLLLSDEGAEVEPLVVSSAFRRQGVGRALLECALERARDLEVRYLSVRPVARNEEAILFYHTVGFRTLGYIELFMDLKPEAPGDWKPGPELFGYAFDY